MRNPMCYSHFMDKELSLTELSRIELEIEALCAEDLNADTDDQYLAEQRIQELIDTLKRARKYSKFSEAGFTLLD